MAKKKVFISFDYENDRRYKYLLQAWDANDKFDFCFNDTSSHEINSYNVDRIKAGLTRKINEATHTLVLIGEEANKLHQDHKLIGYRNWINFEIANSKKNRNKLVAVKLDREHASPDELLNSGASWAMSFSDEAITTALENA
jgi:hypothetical protein